MAEEVKMPQMGESIAEGTIVRWLKQVGDAVKRDEPLFEISTDKVDAEIPSPTSGTLLEIKAKEGETVAVNSVVAIIGSGDAKPAPAAAPVAEAPAPPATPPPAPTVAAPPAAAAVTAPPVQAAPPAPVAQASGVVSGEEVKMPQMGESIAEGTIVRWLKQVGDAVKRDEPLFEISTDKVDAEIPSPTSGTLLEIKAKEGETVAVNSVVAIIGSGDAKPAPAAAPVAEAPATPAEQPSAATPVIVAAPAAPTASAPSAGDSRSVKSSPVVRKIAEEHGVDISRLQGTGIDGRVTKQDILKFIEDGGAGQAATAATSQAGAAPVQSVASTQAAAPVAAPTAPASAPTAPLSKPAAAVQYGAQPFADGDRVEIEPMSIMRRKIAERMVESKHTSAHVYSLIEVDYSKTSALRDKLKGEYLQRDGVKLTFMPFIIKAVIEGLKKFPIINSSVWGDQMVYKKEYNIGVAVALDWGLIVPVVRHADEKSLLGLAKAVNDLGERARGKKLKPDEVQGGTFTITNPGVYGGLIGLPIINQPQVAILGVGGIKKRPVVVDDAIAIRQIGMLSLSYDHRVVDGAQADQFLAFVRDIIEAAEFTS